MKQNKLYWRTNEYIRAPELRVIDEKGKQIGVVTTSNALKMAKDKGLTLVEVAPNAKPPVAKIVEFGKFKYQEEKKQRSANKSKGGELKEVRFSPFIADNDYNTRLTRVKEFLGEKDKVRLVVVFKGPQMRSRNFGYKLLDRIVAELGESSVVDMEPKFLGKHLMMVISPTTRRASKDEKPDKTEEIKHEQTKN